MLDIAEICFIRMSDMMIKQQRSVREVFSKYSIPDILPGSKQMLELLSPMAFFEGCKVELGMYPLSDVEISCLMRVLAKPELDDAIILNELALILENFGVPLIDGPAGTLSDDEDYCCEGESKPRSYDIT
jgi:hypothetical protein